MSIELTDAVANSEYMLGHAIPHFEAGKLPGLDHALGFATLYRRRGVARLLIAGVVDPLFIAQMQTVSAYLFAMPGIADDDKVTSWAACFWDAVGAQYLDAATKIAALSRMTHNPKREHEDDFLYVAFLMQRYFLAPGADAPPEAAAAHAREQQQRLERWEEVLDGALDIRLGLCHALLERDATAFEDTLVAMADARSEELQTRCKQGNLRKEDLGWLQPIWPEGLALLRLAERDGILEPGLVVPGVPPVIHVDNPYVYDPNAWRSPDFRPRRSS